MQADHSPDQKEGLAKQLHELQATIKAAPSRGRSYHRHKLADYDHVDKLLVRLDSVLGIGVAGATPMPDASSPRPCCAEAVHARGRGVSRVPIRIR